MNTAHFDSEEKITMEVLESDREKMKAALNGLELSIVGHIIREDLLGLLEYTTPEHIAQLTVERRRFDRKLQETSQSK